MPALRALAYAAGMLALSAVPVAAQGGATNPRLEALITAASAEREVIYQAPDPESGLPAGDFLRDMAALTEKLYRIKVNIKIDNSINFPAAAGKVVTEIKSGAPPSYDLMFQNLVTGIPLYLNKAFEPVPWLDLFKNIAPQDVALNGAALIVDTQFIVPTYNSRIVRAQDVPKTWDDIVDPKWKGKLGVLVNNEPWSLLAQPNAWGRERAIAFLKRMMELNPKLGRLPEAHQRVLSGETPLNAFGQYERAVHYRDQRKAPISAVETVDPLLTYVYIFMVPKGARSRNAATLIAAAMMSDEGQQLHQKYRSAASMFRPGTRSNAMAKSHKVITPQMEFLLSPEFPELNKQISALIAERR